MDIKSIYHLFMSCINKYHEFDHINTPCSNPYVTGLEKLFYEKSWIDTVQWHLEDLIRDPHISSEYALELKRKIDTSNQKRTDLVESIDDYFFNMYQNINILPQTRINTETPAWAIDRLSILCLKLYHFNEEVNRENSDKIQKKKASEKLIILKKQVDDLMLAISQLFKEIEEGKCKITTYKQMKMYNDSILNPVLRKKNNKDSVGAS